MKFWFRLIKNIKKVYFFDLKVQLFFSLFIVCKTTKFRKKTMELTILNQFRQKTF